VETYNEKQKIEVRSNAWIGVKIFFSSSVVNKRGILIDRTLKRCWGGLCDGNDRKL
jgi:hypothetical protein